MTGEEYHIIISGDVHGVFFRAFIRDNALRLGIKGYVTNLHDGSVEAVLQGPDKPVKHLIDLCRSGPSAAAVKDVKIDKRPQTAIFEDFSINY